MEILILLTLLAISVNFNNISTYMSLIITGHTGNRQGMYLSRMFYFMGYKGELLPRWLRKTFAESEYHRAWISGWNSNFYEGDKRCGVCERDFIHYKIKQNI